MSSISGMTIDQAIATLRASPSMRQTMIDAYLEADARASAEKFFVSGEFAEVRQRVGGFEGKIVLDMGAGRGISSYAFCKSGAKKVFCLEPDPSELVGRGALQQLVADLPCEIIDGVGEAVPLPDASVDVAYCRQVLHHTRDLPQVMRELFRVIKPGGVMLCCREHVVDDEKQLAQFLAEHPVHQLAGGENAFRLDEYQQAITRAGFKNLVSLPPLGSLISAFPMARTQAQLQQLQYQWMRSTYGRIARIGRFVPGWKAAKLKHLPVSGWPGRLFTFQADKPR